MQDHLKTRLENADTIYFVCSGNIIRSSFAELFARHLGMDNVASYGTTYHNTSIHKRSKDELLKLGVDANLIDNFSPTHIEDISGFSDNDIHVVMTSKHRNQLLKSGIAENQIVKITEILGYSKDVADPYFQGNYEEAYSTIKEAVSQINTTIT